MMSDKMMLLCYVDHKPQRYQRPFMTEIPYRITEGSIYSLLYVFGCSNVHAEHYYYLFLVALKYQPKTQRSVHQYSTHSCPKSVSQNEAFYWNEFNITLAVSKRF